MVKIKIIIVTYLAKTLEPICRFPELKQMNIKISKKYFNCGSFSLGFS